MSELLKLAIWQHCTISRCIAQCQGALRNCQSVLCNVKMCLKPDSKQITKQKLMFRTLKKPPLKEKEKNRKH